MSIKPWAKMPVTWIKDGTIKFFSWPEDKSTSSAALMLFFTMCHYATEHIAKPADLGAKQIPATIDNVLSHLAEYPDVPSWARPDVGTLITTAGHKMIVRLTYDDLNQLTGLSRKLISSGLQKLKSAGIIDPIGFGTYGIKDLEDGMRWAKLPGGNLLSPARTSFLPFTHFNSRSQHELHALKLYLYYASIRDHKLPYSEASFETIYQRTGVSERHIPTANSLLLTTGLLVRAGRDPDQDLTQYGPNRYYMAGYKALVQAT